MKLISSVRIVLLASALFFFSGLAFASCGDVPVSPGFLDGPPLTQAELDTSNTVLEQYFGSLNAFQDCIDGAIQGLNVEAPDFQTQFDNLAIYNDLIEEAELQAINKYNNLVETVVVPVVA